MYNIFSNSLSKIGLFSALSCLAFSQAAQAEPTGYNQISFNVEANQEVENDQVTATLYKQIQSSNPKQLATQLNTVINQALSISKRYPTVTTTTGSQNTYPQYDDKGKIVGWTGTVSVDLKSNDFAKASELIANLQETLLVQNIQFGVSESKQKQLETDLIKKASLKFRDQANSLAETWGMSGYQIINVAIASNGGYQPHPVMLMRDASAVSGVPAQKFEGGNTRLSVSANGTIELIPFMR
ncbi:SIMPL domain-containing protein [Psychrobacter sp.]|uniref:SIMPL domain-containing protein n=1 Tax=Psychrobacter sp. TaxID=56811 RepID=UPI0025CC10AA|nr:SIMPL domain-containing protein [Psychrobacter sp.]